MSFKDEGGLWDDSTDQVCSVFLVFMCGSMIDLFSSMEGPADTKAWDNPTSRNILLLGCRQAHTYRERQPAGGKRLFTPPEIVLCINGPDNSQEVQTRPPQGEMTQ